MTILLLLVAGLTLWALLVFLLTLHELGHLWAMDRVGIKADKVVVGAIKIFTITMGGVSFEYGFFPIWAYVASKHYEHSTTDKRAIVAAAGPLVSLVTGLLFYAYNAIHPVWLVGLCAKGSFVLLATNLIPLPPLDGWTMLEHFLVRMGVQISPRHRKFLLCAGIVAIALATLAV